MDNLDIQVGDRVTWKDKIGDVCTWIISSSDSDVKMIKEQAKEILKIERPKYEVIKEPLLTNEEREFLKDMTKHYEVDKIIFDYDALEIWEGSRMVSVPDYPKNIKFKNLERGKSYTLKDLGLEEKV